MAKKDLKKKVNKKEAPKKAKVVAKAKVKAGCQTKADKSLCLESKYLPPFSWNP